MRGSLVGTGLGRVARCIFGEPLDITPSTRRTKHRVFHALTQSQQLPPSEGNRSTKHTAAPELERSSKKTRPVVLVGSRGAQVVSYVVIQRAANAGDVVPRPVRALVVSYLHSNHGPLRAVRPAPLRVAIRRANFPHSASSRKRNVHFVARWFCPLGSGRARSAESERAYLGERLQCGTRRAQTTEERPRLSTPTALQALAMKCAAGSDTAALWFRARPFAVPATLRVAWNF